MSRGAAVAIDSGGMKYTKTNVPQPDLEDCFADEVISVNIIFCPWPEYGRPIKAEHVMKLLTKHGPFDMAKTRIALSLRNDGKYACVDGNHTVEWARKEGLSWVRARVYIDKTLKEEAQLFAAFDTQRRMNPVQSFMTRVAAGYERETRILRIVKEHGYNVSHRSDDGYVSAVSTLGQIHDTYGATVLADTLSIIKSAFGAERAGLNGEALMGIAGFWRRYNLIAKREDIINFLALTGAHKMLHLASMHRTLNRSDELPTAYGKQLRDIYNKRHPRKPLPEWKKYQYSEATKAAAPERARKAAATRRAQGVDFAEAGRLSAVKRREKGEDLSETAKRAYQTRMLNLEKKIIEKKKKK